MSNHDLCVIQRAKRKTPDGRTVRLELHQCPPCPHGLVQGYELEFTGAAQFDHQQREVNLRRIDNSWCGDAGHNAALKARAESQV